MPTGNELVKLDDLATVFALKIDAADKGAANGVAGLDASGKVPSSQLPSYVDDVIEGYYYNGTFYSDSDHTTPITAETGKIYVDIDSSKSYRYSGSAYYRIDEVTVDDALSDTSTNPVQNKVITAALNEKAPAIYSTASGSVASFSDGADDMPITKLMVAIKPQQDLHGYDHPWPAGGTGVNLIPTGTDTSKGYVDQAYLKDDGTVGSVASIAVSEYFAIKPSTVYRLIKTGEQSMISASVCFYDSNKEYITGFGEKYDNRADFTKTSPATAAFARVSLPVSSVTPTTLTFWENSNICPISGWTGANVTRVGKNLLKNTGPASYTSNNVVYQKNADGTVTANGTNDSPNESIYGFPINLQPGNYYFTVGDIGGDQSTYRALFYCVTDGARAKQWDGITNSAAATSDVFYQVKVEAGKQYTFLLYVSSGKTASNLVFKPMVCLPEETDTVFAPYLDQAYPITFPSGTTVYDGDLDAVSGSMKVRPDYDSYNGEPLVGPWISSMDDYAPGTTPTIGAQVVDLGGSESVYNLLALPAIKTRFGKNVFFADCGPVSVTYPADTKLYIDSKLAELQALILENIGG